MRGMGGKRRRLMRGKGDAGFSLIEMVVATAVIMILGGLFFLGPDVVRRRKVEQYARDLCGQIRVAQTVAMARPGRWRLCLYAQDGEYFCVMERAGNPEAVSEGGTGRKEEHGWEEQSERVGLGHTGEVTYTFGASMAEEGLLCEWRFNRDTGSCTVGAGTITVAGFGVARRIAVYAENGRCELLED